MLKQFQITKTRVRVNDSTGLFVLNRHAYTSIVLGKTLCTLCIWKKLWLKALVCAFVIFPSFVSIQDFLSFKLTPLQVACHFSVLAVSGFSDVKMQYTIKSGNSCVRYDALFENFMSQGQLSKSCMTLSYMTQSSGR